MENESKQRSHENIQHQSIKQLEPQQKYRLVLMQKFCAGCILCSFIYMGNSCAVGVRYVLIVLVPECQFFPTLEWELLSD